MIEFDVSRPWIILRTGGEIAATAADELARAVASLRDRGRVPGGRPAVMDAEQAAVAEETPLILLSSDPGSVDPGPGDPVDAAEPADPAEPAEGSVPDGFAWRAGESRIEIYGGSERDLLYGTLDFLEALGFRYLFPGPGGIVLPRPASASRGERGAAASRFPVARARSGGKPRFAGRGLEIGAGIGAREAAEWVEWAGRNRLNFIALERGQGRKALAAIARRFGMEFGAARGGAGRDGGQSGARSPDDARRPGDARRVGSGRSGARSPGDAVQGSAVQSGPVFGFLDYAARESVLPPLCDEIARELDLLESRGERTVRCRLSPGRPAGFNSPNAWVFARLCWDGTYPALDVWTSGRAAMAGPAAAGLSAERIAEAALGLRGSIGFRERAFAAAADRDFRGALALIQEAGLAAAESRRLLGRPDGDAFCPEVALERLWLDFARARAAARAAARTANGATDRATARGASGATARGASGAADSYAEARTAFKRWASWSGGESGRSRVPQAARRAARASLRGRADPAGE